MSAALSDPAALSQALAVLLLLAARMAPLAWLVPWLSPRAGAPLAGAALSLALSVSLWPVALSTAPALPTALPSLLALALREALLGAVFAFALALPLAALRWAGAFIERARGSFDEPAQGALAELLLWLGVVAFFALGGHRAAIDALAAAVVAHPVGLLEPLTDPAALALGASRLLAEAFAGALLIALPVLAALLVAELALQLSLRLSGALPLAALLPGGRVAVSLGMVWVTSGFVLYGLPRAFDQGLAAAARLWQAL